MVEQIEQQRRLAHEREFAELRAAEESRERMVLQRQRRLEQKRARRARQKQRVEGLLESLQREQELLGVWPAVLSSSLLSYSLSIFSLAFFSFPSLPLHPSIPVGMLLVFFCVPLILVP